MKISFTDPSPPAGEDAVLALESSLGTALPSSYRTFLVATNGGALAPCTFAHDLVLAPRYLYALGAADRPYLDVERRNATSGPFPPGTIAIGEDGGGNSYLLVVDGSQSGSVLFWDHEFELAQTDPDNPRLEDALRAGTARVVCADFAEFLDGLEPPPA